MIAWSQNISMQMGKNKKKVIEHQISVVKYFLENADFSDLRYRCSKLDSDKEVLLIIPHQFKDMHIRFNETTLYPKWKF